MALPTTISADISPDGAILRYDAFSDDWHLNFGDKDVRGPSGGKIVRYFDVSQGSEVGMGNTAGTYELGALASKGPYGYKLPDGARFTSGYLQVHEVFDAGTQAIGILTTTDVKGAALLNAVGAVNIIQDPSDIAATSIVTTDADQVVQLTLSANVTTGIIQLTMFYELEVLA